jgi:hypothetical protein
MENQTDIAAGTCRPEVFILDVVEPVALQTWISRIDL